MVLGLGELSQGLSLLAITGGVKLLSNGTSCGDIVNSDAVNIDQLTSAL